MNRLMPVILALALGIEIGYFAPRKHSLPKPCTPGAMEFVWCEPQAEGKCFTIHADQKRMK